MKDLTPRPEPLPAARERVIQVLQHHFANDTLTAAELESRLQEAYAARSVSDLDNIVVDLPLGVTPRGDTIIRATLSGHERKLSGTMPPELQLVARMGYVELDLRDAVFAPGVTVIDVRSFIGYVEILLPEGIRVENHGHALFGYFAVKGTDEDSDRIVRITGRAMCGYAEVVLPDAETDEED